MYSGNTSSGDFARNILTGGANYYQENSVLANGIDLTVYSPVAGQKYQVSYGDDGTYTTCYNVTAGVSQNTEVVFPDYLAEG